MASRAVPRVRDGGSREGHHARGGFWSPRSPPWGLRRIRRLPPLRLSPPSRGGFDTRGGFWSPWRPWGQPRRLHQAAVAAAHAGAFGSTAEAFDSATPPSGGCRRFAPFRRSERGGLRRPTAPPGPRRRPRAVRQKKKGADTTQAHGQSTLARIKHKDRKQNASRRESSPPLRASLAPAPGRPGPALRAGGPGTGSRREEREAPTRLCEPSQSTRLKRTAACSRREGERDRERQRQREKERERERERGEKREEREEREEGRERKRERRRPGSASRPSPPG